jgi:hypothetical protein
MKLQLDAGFRRMCVMVPELGRADFKASIARLRKKWKAAGVT